MSTKIGEGLYDDYCLGDKGEKTRALGNQAMRLTSGVPKVKCIGGVVVQDSVAEGHGVVGAPGSLVGR